MADQKISDMPAAATLDGTEIVPLVQTGANVQDTVTNVVNETLATAPATFRTTLGLGTMAVQNANNVSITGGAISGTTVTGYVPTSRTITAGTGLSGGGDLSVNRTLAINNTGVVAGTYGSSTTVPVIAVNAQGQITSASSQTLSAASINLAYGQFIQNGATALTGAMTNNSTTPIQVSSTAGFVSAGFLIIEQEIVQYTGKTATTFTGITRGVKGTTNVSHDPGAPVTEAAVVASGSVSAALAFDTTVFSNNVSVQNSSEVTFVNTGIYNIQFSVQFLNYTTSDDNVVVWFKQNGTDIAESASVQFVASKHGSSPGAVILALNLLASVPAAGNVQLFWASETGNTVVGSYPAGTSPVHPVAPSVILTVTQVA